MAITTVDGLLTGVPQVLPFQKTVVNTAGLGYTSLWRFGTNPAAGTDPAMGVAGAALTNATGGSIAFTNPASGLTYLARLLFNAGVEAQLYLYDRLWHNSGLSPTLTTSQTVNSVTLPSRCPVATDPSGETFDTSGNRIEPWFQVMGTAMGAGSVSPTITYTDQDGNTGATGVAQSFQTGMVVNRTIPFGLAAGDTGVRSIQAYQATATNTSGVFSLVLRRRLASIRLPDWQEPVLSDWARLGMPVIPNDAHLELLMFSSGSATVTANGEITLVQG